MTRFLFRYITHCFTDCTPKAALAALAFIIASGLLGALFRGCW